LDFRCTQSQPQDIFNFTALTPEALYKPFGFKMSDPPEFDAQSLLGLEAIFTTVGNELEAEAEDFEVTRRIVHFSS
jgi:hypothetical protein